MRGSNPVNEVVRILLRLAQREEKPPILFKPSSFFCLIRETDSRCGIG